MLENVQMIYECYAKMLTFYKPENIEFLGFPSGGALIHDLITYINEPNDSGSIHKREIRSSPLLQTSCSEDSSDRNTAR